MNNEPVAYVDPIWMDRPDLVMSHQLEIGKLFARTQFKNYVPLYTHPVKEQDESFDRTASHMAGEYVSYPVKELTLTDAEISDFTHRMVLCCGVHPNSADINVLGLKFIVEEILRKAQE